MSDQYNHDLARTPDQAKRMRDLSKRQVCAFCRDNLEHETTSPIEIETEHWVVKANDYPYERTKSHILIIPKVHVKTISDLPNEAQNEFLSVISQAEKLYGLTSYALAMRSGDMRYNGSTVEHVHAHVIAGDPNHPDTEPVRFKVSSRPEKPVVEG